MSAKTKIKRLDPAIGKVQNRQLPPEKLAKLRADVSKRFTPDGKDRLFPKMIAHSKRPSKRKSPQPA